LYCKDIIVSPFFKEKPNSTYLAMLFHTPRYSDHKRLLTKNMSGPNPLTLTIHCFHNWQWLMDNQVRTLVVQFSLKPSWGIMAYQNENSPRLRYWDRHQW
jgi:hypothetical protein